MYVAPVTGQSAGFQAGMLLEEQWECSTCSLLRGPYTLQNPKSQRLASPTSERGCEHDATCSPYIIVELRMLWHHVVPITVSGRLLKLYSQPHIKLSDAGPRKHKSSNRKHKSSSMTLDLSATAAAPERVAPPAYPSIRGKGFV